MKFLIVTFAPLLKIEGSYYSYGPYVKEMNIWLRHTDEVAFCCPTTYSGKDLLLEKFDRRDIAVFSMPELLSRDVLNPLKLFGATIQLIRGMKWADHIHLRAPGNISLLGCFVQIMFPAKQKTAKYAGNWDWKSRQPWTYKLQQRIIRNTLVTRNMKALVYGEWPDRTKNIKPFFTASYSERDRIPMKKTALKDCVKLAFIGTLTENKKPLTCVEVLNVLRERNINATLTYCGDGFERTKIEEYVSHNSLQERVKMLGNVNSIVVSKVLQDAHFLILLSGSEGWPKVVSEAMWWGCLPITTPVSCVGQMLGGGERGEAITDSNLIPDIIEKYLLDETIFVQKAKSAQSWSWEYTIERFEKEISQLFY